MSQAVAVQELFVPGRVCLFGEHSDWAGGFRRVRPDLEPGHCLVTGTEQGLWARAEPLVDVLEIASVRPGGGQVGPERIPAKPAALVDAARRGGFFSYAAGVAAEIARGYSVGGLSLHVHEATLPMKKGLSSSAAICVLVARAYGYVYGLGLSARDEMELAYAGERLTGSECGRMDQVCALGRRPSLLTFDRDQMQIEPISPEQSFHLLIVDLGRAKDTRRILADLNRCFPDAPGELARGVREALGPRNAELVQRARAALEHGDARHLGQLMSEAQAAFDRLVAPACPELEAPRLHEVLGHRAVRDLAFGGKGVGSQGDGCAQLVARDPDARDELARRLHSDLALDCLPLTIS